MTAEQIISLVKESMKEAKEKADTFQHLPIKTYFEGKSAAYIILLEKIKQE